MIGFATDQEPIAHPIARHLHGLFPPGAHVAFAEPSDAVDPLFPEEEAHVRRAVPSRWREYALGRMCARRALDAMGTPAAVLPSGADRAPVWPPGFVGSITHCRGFVGAVVTTSERLRGIGFDVELLQPLGDSVVPMVCTASEYAWIQVAAPLPGGSWAKALFSAKEAVHKCVYPLTGIMLDFTDITLAVDQARGTFSVHAERDGRRVAPTLTRVAGRIAVGEGLVFTSAVIGH